MSRRLPLVLAAIAAGLILLLVAMQAGDRREDAGRRLLPDLESAAAAIDEVRVMTADDNVVLQRGENDWRVASRDGYPADIGVLRPLVIALAEARIVEQKTANAEYYERLGVADPADGGNGIGITLAGPADTWSVVLGDSAQGSYRYARVADDATSYVIDRNPDVPADASGWLLRDIVDIGADEIRQVVIAHADGETIAIGKADREQSDFDVSDIPAGRSLRYATIGNGIAGALSNLQLDDVRARADGRAVATATFDSWDGSRITARIIEDGDSRWVEFDATAGEDATAPSIDVSALNERLSGWQYRLPERKQDLLLRRRDDLLSAPAED